MSTVVVLGEKLSNWIVVSLVTVVMLPLIALITLLLLPVAKKERLSTTGSKESSSWARHRVAMYLSPQTAWPVRRFLSRFRYRWHDILALGLLLALLAGILPPVLDNLLR